MSTNTYVAKSILISISSNNLHTQTTTTDKREKEDWLIFNKWKML